MACDLDHSEAESVRMLWLRQVRSPGETFRGETLDDRQDCLMTDVPIANTQCGAHGAKSSIPFFLFRQRSHNPQIHSHFFIIVAGKDTLIPKEQSYNLYEVLKANGVECELAVAEGAEHGQVEAPLSSWPEGVSWWEDAVRPGLDWIVMKSQR